MSNNQTSGSSLAGCNDSDSLSSSSSGDEREMTQAIFQEQVKFFCQMKDFLLSQQTALRQQLQALSFKVTKKKKKPHHRRIHHMAPPSCNNLHIPGVSVSVSDKTEGLPDHEPDIPRLPSDNVPHFFSCSSTDRSDCFQACPICGIEVDIQDSTEVLEDHVVSHWSQAGS